MARPRIVVLLGVGVAWVVAVVAAAWQFLVPAGDVDLEGLLVDDMPVPPSVAKDEWVVKLTERDDVSWPVVGEIDRVWSTVGDTEGRIGILHLSVAEHRNSWFASRGMTGNIERFEDMWGSFSPVSPPEEFEVSVPTTFESSVADEFEFTCYSPKSPCKTWNYFARYDRYVVTLSYGYAPISEEDFEELVLAVDEHMAEALSG